MPVMKKIILFLVLYQFIVMNFSAQQTFPYNGIFPKDVTSVAFIHANVVIDYSASIEDATLIISQGKIISVGKNISIPDNAVIYDLNGRFIYPTFIDLFSAYGMPKSEKNHGEFASESEENPSGIKGAPGWNPAIKAETSAASIFFVQSNSAKEYRQSGFGVVLSHQPDGIVRGSSALIALGDQPNTCLLKSNVAGHYSFNKGSSSASYPSSLMGSIALLRQTYYDALWYERGGNLAERNQSLDALNNLKKLPSIFEADDKWNVLRADKVGDEFGVQYIIKTNGTEYQRLKDIRASGASLIIPVNYPATWDVRDPYMTRLISLDEMKHWELAASSPAMLTKENIPFVFTSYGLSEKSTFIKNIRKSIERGLKEADALKALTYTPALLIGVEKEIGSIKPGMWANLMITSKNIFAEDNIIFENWVQGKQYIIEDEYSQKIEGNYKLKINSAEYEFKVSEKNGIPKGEIKAYTQSKKDTGEVKRDTLTYAAQIERTGYIVNISFEAKDSIYKGAVRLNGYLNHNEKIWVGKGIDPSGAWINWRAEMLPDTTSLKKDDKKSVEAIAEQTGSVIYPFCAYGRESQPENTAVLIKNATIWTCDKLGNLEDTDILLQDGKIKKIGKNIDASAVAGVRVIDGKGKHVSPGIVDEHSHIALVSVNEGGQSCSAEVEEERVIWPEDINIYRQLSGGVTTIQLLHGSANPIGGRSAVIKLKWGENADGLIIKNPPKFIKFALGENVVQSNWPNDGKRFPQTRMGVEQFYYDHFTRAREYENEWKNYNDSQRAMGKRKINIISPPRKDLEMDALVEILNEERFVTCHSYVQSEINMLMHVADSMNFRLNTFTHILEGYKLADKMKSHGVGASTFSDWWAYKYEVKDAIPYNGALMWEQGLTVAYNSDDAEMARRLNQEAAKAVKYGGVPEEEALKFVTLNPAKLLHIDDRTGSLIEGKDADVVVWTDNPLSIYAKVEQTFIDGICYFDKEEDEKMREKIKLERARLVLKMLNSKSDGEQIQQPRKRSQKHFHCDTLDQTSEGKDFYYINN